MSMPWQPQLASIKASRERDPYSYVIMYTVQVLRTLVSDTLTIHASIRTSSEHLEEYKLAEQITIWSHF